MTRVPTLLFLLCIFLGLACGDKVACGPDGDHDTSIERMYPLNRVRQSVKSFLGRDLLDILSMPDRVECFRIGFHKSGRGDAGAAVGGYPVLARGKDLNPKQIDILQSVFFNEDTYRFDVVKKCLFLPEYAFRVVRGGTEAVIIISYSCKEVVFQCNGVEKMEDFDNAVNMIKFLTDSVF